MILVTGASGFIGSVLIGYLNKKGICDILAVDKFNSNDKWRNLTGKKFREFIDREQFLSKINDYRLSGIFHIGACADTTMTDMDYLYNTNTYYSKILLNYAAENNIPFIFASSAAVYGDGSEGYSDSNEMIYRYRPLNGYGFSKYMFDYYLLQSTTRKPTNWYSFRFFNVYGPNEYHKGRMASVVMHAYNQLVTSGKIRLFKSHRPDFLDGEQKRDFIYVFDVVDVLYYFYSKKPESGIYNLGTGVARSFNELAKSVISFSKIDGKIEYFDMPEDIRLKYQYHTQADIEKLRKAGYDKNFYCLEDGVKEYVQQYLISKDRYY